MSAIRRKQLIAAAVAILVAGLATVLVTRGGSPERTEGALTVPSSTAKPTTSAGAKGTTTTSAKEQQKQQKKKQKPTATSTPGAANKAPDTPAAAGQPGAPAPAATGPAPRSGAGPYRVATAKGASVDVQLATPTGADGGPPKLDARPAFAGDQRATAPLPRLEQPVQGRFATETGYRFDSPQPFGDPLTLLVVRSSGDWLQVQLPVRPNGTMGWVKKSDVNVTEVGSHVEVNVAERKLRIFQGSSMVAEAPVAVGTPGTPTPTGRHFMTDRLREPSGAKRQPWSLGISAYSEQLDTFDGGAPQIAMHGWPDSSVFGQARSNGCIRVPGATVEQLAALPLGTPIDVYGS